MTTTPTHPTEKKCKYCSHGICKVCGFCHNQDSCDASQAPIKACYDQLLPHTTDKGWEEKLLSGLTSGLPTHFSRDGETYLHPQFRDFIQHIAKEEYERGRKDVVEFLLDHPDDRYYAEDGRPLGNKYLFKTLEAALETPS